MWFMNYTAKSRLTFLHKPNLLFIISLLWLKSDFRIPVDEKQTGLSGGFYQATLMPFDVCKASCCCCCYKC